MVKPLAVRSGNTEASVIVCGPAPGMAKLIVSASAGVALASITACRSVAVPLLAVLETTRIAPVPLLLVCGVR